MPAADAEVEFELRPSRLHRLATACLWALALVLAPVQALRLEAPWPLLLLIVLPLVLRGLPECVPQRLRVAGHAVEARTATGHRSGCVAGRLALTGWALEIPVRWNDGRRDRIVVWRDAVDDADYRRLARILRQRPAGREAPPRLAADG